MRWSVSATAVRMYERSGRRADRLPSLACWQPRNLTSVDKASQLSQVVSRAPRPPGSARADGPGVGRKVNVKRAGGGRDLLRRLSSRGGLPGRLCVVMLLSARAWPDGGHRGGRVVGAPPTKGRISRNRDALRSELNKSCLFYFRAFILSLPKNAHPKNAYGYTHLTSVAPLLHASSSGPPEQ